MVSDRRYVILNIYGRKVELRAIEFEDSNMIVEMFNDPEIEKNVIGWAYPVSYYSHTHWFEGHYNECNLRFVVQTIIDRKPVGMASLTDVDWKNRRAVAGIKLSSKEERRKGYGTDIFMALMRYAFDELGFERLDSYFIIDNEASKRLHSRCGLKTEGIKRNYIYKNGQFKDVVFCGILKEEYYELIEKNRYWMD